MIKSGTFDYSSEQFGTFSTSNRSPFTEEDIIEAFLALKSRKSKGKP